MINSAAHLNMIRDAGVGTLLGGGLGDSDGEGLMDDASEDDSEQEAMLNDAAEDFDIGFRTYANFGEENPEGSIAEQDSQNNMGGQIEVPTGSNRLPVQGSRRVRAPRSKFKGKNKPLPEAIPFVKGHWRKDGSCLLYTSPSPRDS